MFALGLVLLVVSGAAALGVALSNTDPVPTASAFGVSLSNVSIGGLFLAGAIAGMIFMLGLSLMVAGAARKRRRRVETKRTVKGVRTEKEQLEAENADLRSRVDTGNRTVVNEPGAGYASDRPIDTTHTGGTGHTNTDTNGTGTTNGTGDTAVVQEKHGLFGRR